jgi:hypothetical protein
VLTLRPFDGEELATMAVVRGEGLMVTAATRASARGRRDGEGRDER